ncbi:NepR family anti-sigma factor [Novosphingobium sp. ZN18A2]|uniref:NepR family anti-sigma factor n=1 Tax=Novosphingobium sp. ZN18A2 TaxID=3079861 RepID=UPI0030CBE38F
MGGQKQAMAEKKSRKVKMDQCEKPDRAKAPEWAQGLRRLYDSVVEEPLPDNFAKLIEQLDKDAHD